MYRYLLLIFVSSAAISVAVSYSKLYLFHVILVLMLLAWLCRPGLILKRLPSLFHYMPLLMLAWYMLSILWSWNIEYSIIYIGYIFFGLTIVWAITFGCDDLSMQQQLFKVLAWVYAIEIVFSLLECTGAFRLPISPYSDYVTYIGREMKVDLSLDATTLEGIFNTPTGFEWNPNHLAALMTILFPFFLFSSKITIKVAGIFSILLIVLFSGSRGAFLAILVELIFYGLLFSRKAMLGILMFGMIMVGAAFSWDTPLSPKFQSVFSSFNAIELYVSGVDESGGSVSVRQHLILNGLNALFETYGVGVGGGTSRYVQEMASNENNETGGVTSMHNFWIEILVEAGLFFFVIYVSWYLYLIFRLWNVSKCSANSVVRYYASSCLIALIGFSVSAISTSSVIYFFPMWLLFGFSIATVNNYIRNREEA